MPRLAVIGFPVGHSRSPAMQNAALAELGLGEGWSYGAVEVPPEGFEATVREIAASGEYAGANVTVPHKLAALALADTASKTAREIGAANTLTFGRDGIQADNTDAGGLLAALPGTPSGLRALVLGAGGAGLAAVWALGEAGASVEIWNRTPARAQTVQVEVTARAEEFQVEIEVRTIEVEPQEGAAGRLDQRGYELIVNTTAVGLRGEDPFAHLPLDRHGFRPGQVVVDMVYGEEPSPLLGAAAEAGARTIDGLEVLVQQGALSLEIWTGREAPIATMRAAARG